MPAAPRSTLVTVVAWVMIALCGMGALVGILQNVMLATMFSADLLPPPNSRGMQGMPGAARFVFENVRLIFFLVLLVFIAGLAVGVGMLQRRAWARIGFIGLMALGIAWNVIGIGVPFAMMFGPGSMPVPPDAEFGRAFVVMRTLILLCSALFALAVSIGFAWLIRRFRAPDLRAEFGAPH